MRRLIATLALLCCAGAVSLAQVQEIRVGSDLAGKRFDGIGAVNGGGDAAHEWKTWRLALYHFSQLLFR